MVVSTPSCSGLWFTAVLAWTIIILRFPPYFSANHSILYSQDLYVYTSNRPVSRNLVE